ncbi:tolQ: protein TolQ [Sporomusa termitida]|uniref:TolQ: protein TolQ n=2 Tax=Sporomusa termitida TaxID=2377 RepID=A0A517DRF9_9FIRM|nr:tolQ: protein TolQ [Sporomusa termitida]
MLPLAACSIVAVAVILERMYFFRHSGAANLAETLLAMITGNQREEAADRAKGSPLPLIRILAAGMAHPYQPAKAMEAVVVNELAAMRRGLPILDTIVTLSPLLGLLGTIIGMIDSFQVMALSGMGQPRAVTGGIAEALIATATGITVAVIALIPYNYFLARIERETEIIEHYATRLELALNPAAEQQR